MADMEKNSNHSVMDYSEHDRTYEIFMIGAKWGTIATLAVLIGMAFGFFAGFGLIGGTVVFAVCLVLAKIFA